MKNTKDMTKGNISKQLISMAIPLIATSLIQTTYNLVDMIWIGKLGSDAITSVGTAGFYMNLAMALSPIFLTGTGIKIAQSFGAKNYKNIKDYISNGLILALSTALIFSLITITFKNQAIAFFNIGVPSIEKGASTYLLITMLGLPITYMNMFFTTVINSFGNSKQSFKYNSVGLLVNIILDPILIFGLGGFMTMGIAGAASASVIANLVVLLIYFNKVRSMEAFQAIKLQVTKSHMIDVQKLGLPFTIQRVSFILIGMLMARLIAGFGPTGIAVQKIGLQVESLSYMTIGGLFGAVSVFIGQNFGIGNLVRIRKGYKVALVISGLFGFLTTSIFLIFSEQIFGLFLNDTQAIALGTSYLKIIGLSQVFMCIEIVSMASFNGLGKTHVPALVSLTFTGLRIPLALYLSSSLGMGLDGIWWAISATSMIKGLLLSTLFLLHIYKQRPVLKEVTSHA